MLSQSVKEQSCVSLIVTDLHTSLSREVVSMLTMSTVVSPPCHFVSHHENLITFVFLGNFFYKKMGVEMKYTSSSWGLKYKKVITKTAHLYFSLKLFHTVTIRVFFPMPR
jgi:hypothetical protein